MKNNSIIPIFCTILIFSCLNLALAKTPNAKRTFTPILGINIISPVANSLYYAYPSPYLFVYDSYSQKIKSSNIDTGVTNVFHQVDFDIGQILFTPQGNALVQNNEVGNQIVVWNYLSNFSEKKKTFSLDISGYKMKPFYPIYDKNTDKSLFYFLAFNQAQIQVLDFEGNKFATLVNDQINFKCACTIPEQSFILTGGTDGVVRVWNFTRNTGDQLKSVHNFTQIHPASVEFLERVVNVRMFLSADNTERKVRIWSLDNLNTSKSYTPSFGDWIIGVRSLSSQTAIVYGNGFSLDYFNILTGNLIKTITLVNKTIVSVEVLSPIPANNQERIAILASNGDVQVYVLSPSNGIIKSYFLFTPIFPQIEKIQYSMPFKRRNMTDNSVINILGIVSETKNKTIFFLNENTMKNVTSYTYSSEIRGLQLVMGRYMDSFQDLLLVWYGNSYTIYQIQSDASISLYVNYNSPSGRTIEQLGLVYYIGIWSYAYAYVSVIDKNNVVTILNTSDSATNVTYFKEQQGIKLFCSQNYFSNFAYGLSDGTLKVKYINQTDFTVKDITINSVIVQPEMTACFSKQSTTDGYYMTTNKTNTSVWLYDGSLTFTWNFTNVSALVYEGITFFTAVNSGEKKVHVGVIGVGDIATYIVGDAPSKNGLMIQLIDNFYYALNEKEFASFSMDCPLGSTQLGIDSFYWMCVPNSCNNTFFSLQDLNCLTSCPKGTFSEDINDPTAKIYTKVCKSFNSSIMNCELGDSSNSKLCSKCENNYFLLSTISESGKYNFCAQNKLDKRLATISTKVDGTGDAYWCDKFLSHCYKCDWNPSHCDVCDWNYYRKKTDGFCTNCTNATEFHNDTNNGSTFCYNCSDSLPFCYICNGNSSNCTQCFNNYYFDEGDNLACSGCSKSKYAKIGKKDGSGFCRNCLDIIDNCVDCTEYGERCTQCNNLLYIDVDYNCTNCTEINKYKNGSNSGFGYCMYCNYSMPHCLNCYGNKSDCQLCMEDYYFYTDRSCVDCLQGNFYRIGSGDGNGTCHDCYTARPNCYLCNNNPAHCDLCFSNFWFDENNTCSNCSQTYFPSMYKNGSFNGSGKCLYCKDAIEHCNQCTNNATGCTHCDTNYYITYKNLTCSDCLSNSTFKNSTGDGYGICYPCSVAYTGCFICDYPNNKCILCFEDYFLNENYRCQPYTFRPEYKNVSLTNSSLNMSFVNNRRYIILVNPCDYDRNQWSLDARLHSYWIASTNFEKVDSATLDEIESRIKSLGSNETKPNYSDPDWTFYGDTKNNKLVVTGRHNVHYKTKYFCIYGNTFSDETKPGVFDFYFPENTGKNGVIYLNLEDHLSEDFLSPSLSILACGVQYASGINDTNQIWTEVGNHCDIHVDYVNITSKETKNLSNSSNNNSNNSNNSNNFRRILATDFIETNINFGMSYIFTFKKDVVYVNDTSSSLLQNLFEKPEFYELLYRYLIALNPSISFPKVISGYLIETNGIDIYNSLPPKIDPNFVVTSRTTGVLSFIIGQNDGFFYMGIEKNRTVIPSFYQLKRGFTDQNTSLDYYASMYLKKGSNFTFNLYRLNPNIYYTFYYASQNFYGQNTSDINAYQYAINISKIPKQDIPPTPDNGDTEKIIIAVVCSVVGTIILILVVFFCVRWYKLRKEKVEKEETKKNKKKKKKPEGTAYTEVIGRSPGRSDGSPEKPSRPGDILLTSVENLGSGKDVIKMDFVPSEQKI